MFLRHDGHLVVPFVGPGLLFAYLGRKGRSKEPLCGNGLEKFAVLSLLSCGTASLEATDSSGSVVGVNLGLSLEVTGGLDCPVECENERKEGSKSGLSLEPGFCADTQPAPLLGVKGLRPENDATPVPWCAEWTAASTEMCPGAGLVFAIFRRL